MPASRMTASGSHGSCTRMCGRNGSQQREQGAPDVAVAEEADVRAAQQDGSSLPAET